MGFHKAGRRDSKGASGGKGTGLKKRKLERVANYEYELPENFVDEDVDDEIAGYDEWDEPKVIIN